MNTLLRAIRLVAMWPEPKPFVYPRRRFKVRRLYGGTGLRSANFTVDIIIAHRRLYGSIGWHRT